MRTNQFASWMPTRFAPISDRRELANLLPLHRLSPAEAQKRSAEADRRIRDTMREMRSHRMAPRVIH